MKKELNGDSYPGILSIYKEYLKEKNPQKEKMTYDIFQRGLEIQDLDPITYQIIAKNKNSIGNWFPELTQAVKTGFLQNSRHNDYPGSITTIAINKT